MASRTSVPNSEVLCGKRYTHWGRQRLYYPLSGGRYERKDCVTNDGRVSDCGIVTFVRFAMAKLCQVRFQLRMATAKRVTSNVLFFYARLGHPSVSSFPLFRFVVFHSTIFCDSRLDRETTREKLVCQLVMEEKNLTIQPPWRSNRRVYRKFHFATCKVSFRGSVRFVRLFAWLVRFCYTVATVPDI